jgi:Ion transport protein.
MAKGIRALLDTVMQALPQVGNLGLLFFLLFFIFAALGVELFGRLECSDELPCQGLGEHAHFSNFGMAFLTLFRVATGDNWNGIMKVRTKGRYPGWKMVCTILRTVGAAQDREQVEIVIANVH